MDSVWRVHAVEMWAMYIATVCQTAHFETWCCLSDQWHASAATDAVPFDSILLSDEEASEFYIWILTVESSRSALLSQAAFSLCYSCCMASALSPEVVLAGGINLTMFLSSCFFWISSAEEHLLGWFSLDKCASWGSLGTSSKQASLS